MTTRLKDNVDILLVGSRMADGDDIRRELALIPGFKYTTWYCSDLPDALDFLCAPDRGIDLIFLDLSLFNADYPKEYFLEVKKAIPDTPIVVMTEESDHDLTAFVMASGAAEIISQLQIRNDPERLRSLVKSCCARDKLAKAEGVKTANALQDAKDLGAQNLQQEQAENIQILDAVQRKNTLDNIEMAHENRQLKATKASSDIASGKKIHDAEDALGRSEAELQALQASTAAALMQSKAAHALTIRKLGEENIQLHKDKGLYATSLKLLEEKHGETPKPAPDGGK